MSQITSNAADKGGGNDFRWYNSETGLLLMRLAYLTGILEILGLIVDGPITVDGNSYSKITREVSGSFAIGMSAIRLGLKGGAPSAGGGPSVLFFGDNSAAEEQFLGRISALWENPAAGSEAGAVVVAVRRNAADTTAATEVARFTALGNTVIGPAALPTNATDGFLYIPTCAGTPTGTPSSYPGRMPIVFDTTAKKIWVWDGSAWKQTAALT